MLPYKAGWTDCRKIYGRAHKFEKGEVDPLCQKWGDVSRYRSDPVSTRAPKNACKNCLRIEAAQKKKKGR